MKFTISISPERCPKIVQCCSRKSKPLLICIEGAQVGMQFSLRKPESRMGRNHSNDIWIDDDMASRRHAVILYQNSTHPDQPPLCFLRDLNSMNGTELNGVRITTIRPLVDGDRITVGMSTFGFYIHNEPESD